MFFSTIKEHPSATERILTSLQEDRLGHALLLTGPRGSGQLPLALALARYLHCERPDGQDACGQCPACKKHNNLAHPDLHFSFPIVLNKKEGVEVADDRIDQWREAVQENPYLNGPEWHRKLGNENKQGTIGVAESTAIVKKLNLKAYEGGYKALIMWHPERMNQEAANKLLKILEEPPPKTVFVLISNDPGALLPTIRSRTQVIRLGKAPDEAVANKLIEELGLEPQQAHDIARVADGDQGLAIQMGRADEDPSHLETFANWMRICYKKDIRGAMDWVEEMGRKGREELKQFLSYGLHMTRQCLAGNLAGTELMRLDQEEMDFAGNFRKVLTPSKIQPLMAHLNQAILHLERNGHARIVLLDLSFEVFEDLKKKQ